jgi:hypothetical protein
MNDKISMPQTQCFVYLFSYVPQEGPTANLTTVTAENVEDAEKILEKRLEPFGLTAQTAQFRILGKSDAINFLLPGCKFVVNESQNEVEDVFVLVERLQNGVCRFVKQHNPKNPNEGFYWHFSEVRPVTSVASSRI